MAVKPNKSDAAADVFRFHFARCIFHRVTLALPDLERFYLLRSTRPLKIVRSMNDRPSYTKDTFLISCDDMPQDHE